MNTCANCGEHFNDGVQCTMCKKFLDFGCANVTENGYRRLSAKSKASWKCSACISGSPAPSASSSAARTPEPVSLDMVMSKLNSMEGKLNSMESALANIPKLTSDVEGIKSNISKLQESNRNVIKTVQECTSKVDATESRVTCLEASMGDLAEVRSQLHTCQRNDLYQDQHTRLNNIEIKGVPLKKSEDLFDVVDRIGARITYKVAKSQINYVSRIPTFNSKEKSIVMVEAEAALAAIKAIQIPLELLTLLHLTGPLWPTEPVLRNNTCCDYVIVGGGTSGMVVASRLSEDPDINVCVFEAGGNPPIEALLPFLFVSEPLSKLDWNFTSTFNPHSANSQPGNVTKLTSGKMLGGSSCMDHFIHVRAAPHTFNCWADIVDDPTWNYDNVLPYFKKSEHLKDPVIENSRYVKYHGYEGPMGVARQPSLAANPYLVSFGDVGNKVVLDVNGYDTLGITQSMYILTDGVRQCSAYSYIHPVKDRKNLFVFRHTYVTRIIFDGNKTAIAVEAVKNGEKFIVKASREIILCAGVYKTPQILMLSGIGPEKHLNDFNIEVIADLPVGDNWQEQVTVAIVHKTDKSPVDPLVPLPTIIPFPVLVGLVSLKANQSYADYQVFGIIAGADTPYLVLALTVVFGYKPAITDVIQNKVIGHNSIIGLLGLLNPDSTGYVRLKTANPFDDPEITTNFFKNKKDIKKMISYIKNYIRIENSTFFTQVNASFVDPELPECKKYEFRSDKYWECYVLHMAISVYHPVGTCPMGAVVDKGLRVRGVKSLRIADASVIPDTPRGSPHALVIMIAEKVSDMIKADASKFPSCEDLKNRGTDVELPEINSTVEEKIQPIL